MERKEFLHKIILWKLYLILLFSFIIIGILLYFLNGYSVINFTAYIILSIAFVLIIPWVISFFNCIKIYRANKKNSRLLMTYLILIPYTSPITGFIFYSFISHNSHGNLIWNILIFSCFVVLAEICSLIINLNLKIYKYIES